MASYNAGSVTARIEMDTSEFDKSIKKLIEDVRNLKVNLKDSGADQLGKDVESLKTNFNNLTESVNKLVSVNEDYKKQLSALRNENKNVNKDLTEQSKLYTNLNKSMGRFNELSKTSLGSIKRDFETLTATELKWQSNLTNAINKARIGMKQYDQQIKQSIETEKKRWGQTAGQTGYNNFMSQMRKEMNLVTTDARKLKQEMDYTFRGIQQRVSGLTGTFNQVQAKLTEMTTFFKTTFKKVGDEIEVIKTPLGRVSETLSTFNFKLIEMADAEGLATERATRLAAAMYKISRVGTNVSNAGKVNTGYGKLLQELYAGTNVDVLGKTYKGYQGNFSPFGSSGRLNTVGYSDYTANINKVSKAVKEAELAQKSFSQAVNQTGINLNTYKANLSSVNAKLDEQKAKVNRVKQAQEQLAWIQRTDYLNQYKANMTDINSKLEKQTRTTNKLNQSTRTGQMSMREFGTAMGKAEAYSNNIYRSLQKVRSVMVSIKTIAGAMGLMAVWGFASDLLEGVKETYAAKSEMESTLEQTSWFKKGNADGIKEINDALDDTARTFQRINKYSLGETAASIGLEFNLKPEEIAKSAKIIAMVQNEYARAGRSNEEAALAVKDILQGEFRRLSMETGVGKDDLQEKYGWSGEKDDIMGLMNALEKAGKERHWDIFASKATSLNDVITITKSRFGELGADLVTNIEPMILTAFNGIMGGVDAVKGKFESMGSFGKLTTIGGFGVGAFTTISTALMMLKRNMGLAEIATLGWGRSFGTALMGLKKTDVALHGFWRTLLATISGTNAASMANVGFGKALMSRLLGVKANIAGEEGLLKAIMVSQGALRGESSIMTLTAASGLNLSQKLAAVTNNLSATEVQGMKTATAIRKIVTSTKLLKIAVLGITSVAILSAFAGIAAKADDAKKSLENFNVINKDGSKIVKDAQKSVDKYTEKLNNLSKTDKKYNRVKQQLEIAEKNKRDIESARELLKIHKADYKAREKNIKERRKERIDESLKLASDGKKGLPTTSYEAQMEHAIDVRNKALSEYDTRLYKASQHINQQVSIMKEAGVSEAKRVKYAQEYQAEADNTARLWKKFNEGDLNSGFYAALSELKLIWIDLWNNEHFINFWNSVKNMWNDLKPTVSWLKDNLIRIGEILLDFFSTKQGQIVGGILAISGGIALFGTKIYHALGGTKSTIDILKTMGGKLKKVATGWRKAGDEAKTASEKMGTTTPTSTTGGINGDVGKDGKTSWWKNTGDKLKGDATNYVRAAAAIAAAMVLVTEAILLLRLPMGALAETGVNFKRLEPNIRKGIEGLKLITPVMAVFLPPVVALMLITNKYASSFDIVPSFMASAELIAMSMLLVSEAIVLLNAPLLAIASVGFVNSLLGDNVRKGTEAMKAISDSLVYLAPFIPVFVAGVVLAAAASTGIGAIGLVEVAMGLAIGMSLVTEAIFLLHEPLIAISSLGATYSNLGNVKQGAEAMKVTAEAMGYVEDATRAMTLVQWELLATYIGQLIGVNIGMDLTKLTNVGGFFDQLNTFTTEFNKLNITPVDAGKASSIKDAATSLGGIGDVLKNAKEAIDNIPDDFKNNALQGSTGDQLGIVNNTSTGAISGDGYFDQLKEPLKALKKFIDDFNTSADLDFGEGIDQAKIDTITSAANMLEQVKQAVQKVNDVMWNTGMGNSIANFGTQFTIDFGGLWNNMIGNTTNSGGSSGGYVSSLGSQFQNIEDIVKDLSTFSNNVSGLTAGDKTDNVQSLTSFVSEVKTQIDELVKSLNDNVTKAKDNAKSLGTGIVNGIKDGLKGLNQIGYYVNSTLANTIMLNKDMVYNTSNSLGKTTATKFKEGVNPMSDYMTWELSYVNQAMLDRQTELGDTAYNLGSHIASRFKEGDDINSPGIMARSMQDEMNYIAEYLSNNNLGQMAYDLSNFMSNNFKLDFNLSNFKFPNVSQWVGNLSSVLPTINSFKTQVTTNFTTMKQNVQNSFNSILNKTNTTMTNMKSATLGHIGNIKSSWRGMQDALIASADHIKTQTTSKINTLKSNLGDFWNKVKNPELLISGSAGGHTGSIRRRSRPYMPTTGYAGGFDFKSKRSIGSPDDMLEEYMKCIMETGKPCYAGWGFNWSNNISRRFKGWKTHFNKFGLDQFLNVGKFENNNFPVRGNAEVAKAYIYDVIKATRYGSYFDSHFNDDPVAALRAGVFNCWDGANIILAIARAFGFNGGMGHGTWNGIGHVWASIPGLGNIDATAIQNGYGFTSPKVKGYAGSIKRSRTGATVKDSENNTSNKYEIHIHVNGDNYGIDDLNSKIEDGAKRVARDLFRNNYSGV